MTASLLFRILSLSAGFFIIACTSNDTLYKKSIQFLSAQVEERRNIDENTKRYRQWHTVTLSFEGPETTEIADINPFTDYKLMVEFWSGENQHLIRGFYAADGNAAHSGAASGKIWQVRFTPNKPGEWHYKATLHRGKNIAVSDESSNVEKIALANKTGSFQVFRSNKKGPDFRAPDRGLLKTSNGYFQFSSSQNYWLKGGTNSPENLLAYEGFDGTYRLGAKVRDGEAAAPRTIHSFKKHLSDWREGDPTWANNKGKSLIGAMNYLASEGMNSVYFLTLNITGDGNDVWPYRDPEDVTRFDVSKLEQWNILFDHMQSKGILLHLVTQETENELMLDNGETGFERRLYLNELIARFAHHPALIWNLGEENGPAHWRPEGQNDQQRKDMAIFLKTHDPYEHPILLHTHATPEDKTHIAGPLLGFKYLDGLSFQVANRETVNTQTRKWRQKARNAGKDWLITMDEIGMWHTGAMPDTFNPSHDSLRRHVLWGHLLGGGGGVEWYFGAKFPENDLTVEDFRLRKNLWQQTRHALDFFTTYVPFWALEDCENISDRQDAYCAKKTDEFYILYLPEGGTSFIALPDNANYTVTWFNPLAGGPLQRGSTPRIKGSPRVEIGMPPQQNGNDWVVLIKKQ